MRVSSVLAILPPAIALSAASLKIGSPLIFIMLFFLNGARVSGYGVGRQSYLLDISPAIERPAYLAFMSMLTMPVMLFPPLAGIIIHLSSFEFLFGMAVIFGIITFLLTLKLKEEKEISDIFNNNVDFE